ncbi:hypothetical protein VIOR3934_02892 [Vibrio orientalis CIP 102891 = ATCC 33934]|uniref:Transposase n=2 Tax=Vibrio orientalis TaxID=28175 RepID=C9QK12_VIBOR|nr:hypothetical protein VIA_002651 [Vibrio orientalis CIP 102891 = ATCC 33934]EGU53665.1 hypothetical protein VIOR3934_02892 [Vibrio orientalis CIP 102891 = ATCC 33934]
MRKREERFNWLNMTPAQQLHVIKLCRQRYIRKHRKAPGGSNAHLSDSDPQQDLF